MKKVMVCAVILVILVASAVDGNTEDVKGDQCDGERIEFAVQPESCPCCGFSPVAPIMYGLPLFTEKLKRAIDEGRIALGGCIVPEDPPRWRCKRCRTSFYQQTSETVK